MSILTVLILAAVAATVLSLLFGVSAMATGHDVDHRSSDQWMHLRVGFQALALALVLLALLTR
ncbi:MAG: HIG1 domain-containing protein [Burkholderiales bacterium]|nr:HIG1 domain-containing protein [Burkholderiales bacterium]